MRGAVVFFFWPQQNFQKENRGKNDVFNGKWQPWKQWNESKMSPRWTNSMNFQLVIRSFSGWESKVGTPGKAYGILLEPVFKGFAWCNKLRFFCFSFLAWVGGFFKMSFFWRSFQAGRCLYRGWCFFLGGGWDVISEFLKDSGMVSCLVCGFFFLLGCFRQSWTCLSIFFGHTP